MCYLFLTMHLRNRGLRGYWVPFLFKETSVQRIPKSLIQFIQDIFIESLQCPRHGSERWKSGSHG